MNNEQQFKDEKRLPLFKISAFYHPRRKLSTGTDPIVKKQQQNTSYSQEKTSQFTRTGAINTRESQNFYDIYDVNTNNTSRGSLQILSSRRRTNSVQYKGPISQVGNSNNNSVLIQDQQQQQPLFVQQIPQVNPQRLYPNGRKSLNKIPYHQLYDQISNPININKLHLNQRYKHLNTKQSNTEQKTESQDPLNQGSFTLQVQKVYSSNPSSFRQSQTQGNPEGGGGYRNKREYMNASNSDEKPEQIIINKLLNNSGIRGNLLQNNEMDTNSRNNGFYSSRKILLKKVVSITNESDGEEEEENKQMGQEDSKSYLKDTECYQAKTYTPRNKRHMLLYGKEIPNQKVSKSCQRRSESPNKSQLLLMKTLNQHVQYIRKKKIQPIDQAQSIYSQNVTKEEKIQFKEILVKLLNYEKDMTDDQIQIAQINQIIQEKMKSKSNLEAIAFQDDEVLKERIRNLIQQKHLKMSGVVENLNSFQESYRHIQYGMLTEDKLYNMIDEVAQKQNGQGLKGQELLKNMIRKVQFAQRISFTNKQKLQNQGSMISSDGSPTSRILLNDSMFQNSPMHSINSPMSSPYMSKNQRSEFYQAVGIDDPKSYMKNKINMLQNLFQKKVQSDQEDDRDLIEGMMKCWKFDRKGRIKVKGFQKKKSKKQDIYSADRISRKYAYLRQTIKDFFNKCDKIEVSPALALENKYFNSLPFTRPGSFVLFKSLKEGNLEIVNKMLKSNLEFIYERDHLLQNCLHIAIQKKFRNLSIWLIHKGIDFDLKDVANKTPLYYAIKQKMFDVAKYLLFRRASPWSDNSKYRYDQITSNSAIIRCVKKAKMIDLCGKLCKEITQKQNWINQRKIFYLDQYCRIPGELDCLRPDERQIIEEERKKEEQKDELLLIN